MFQESEFPLQTQVCPRLFLLETGYSYSSTLEWLQRGQEPGPRKGAQIVFQSFHVHVSSFKVHVVAYVNKMGSGSGPVVSLACGQHTRHHQEPRHSDTSAFGVGSGAPSFKKNTL